MSRASFAEAQKARLDASIRHARNCLAPFHRTGFDRLLHAVQSRSRLFGRAVLGAPRANDPSLLAFAPLRGLVAMARRRDVWLAEPETWSPPSRAPLAIFGSLAQHLFARWPMPAFMASAWYGLFDEHRSWYERVGAGESWRRVGIPMPISRAMAHLLLRAPASSTIVGGLRWAQTMAMGGTPALARALVATRLGRALANEDFWETVVRFFATRPEIAHEHVAPIVEMIDERRFGGASGFVDGTYGALAPVEPDFAMEGRTLSSLLALVAERTFGVRIRTRHNVSWRPAPLRPFALVDDEKQHAWSIAELCSSDALVFEGRAMRHCIATYVGRCRRGESSVWTMQIETPTEQRRVLTIEVDMKRRKINCARRRANARASEAERAVLAKWAEQEGIAMLDY